MSDTPMLLDHLIDPDRLEGTISNETRTRMEDMLECISPSKLPPTQDVKLVSPKLVPPSDWTTRPITPSFSSVLPSLVTLSGRILHELETDLPRLLSLNPSRREAIAHHLDKLAGSSPSSSSYGNSDTIHRLRHWIEGPRQAHQSTALRTYFEEVATIALGQALLLKSWSDRGIRHWSESDLGRLNWALSSALKPQIPLDREGWQITRPNLYSWFNPSPILQHEIWVALESWKVTLEGPSFLLTLLSTVRKSQPENADPCGYDPKFFKALWDHMDLLGLSSTPNSQLLKRKKIIFSPTLRDGSIVRAGPSDVNWIGLESSPFQLMLAELMQIWWGPCPPPFWSIGTGLEVHSKDQLALALCSAKPSILSRIAEMEACDAAFVFEEQTVRAQSRNIHSTRFKEQVESLPYFKRLRSAGTSLGDLQACVAISKLRPGGILIWSRQEALSAKEGAEMLNFILNRAKLTCEWDFSELQHSLPSSSPLYPKHLYLFQKESHIEARLSHRPIRHSIQGQMRSHIELELVLEDALQSICQTIQPRGQWTILSHSSPSSQKDWIEKWPDPTSHSVIRKLDQLRIESLPLANLTTIRPTPDEDPKQGGKWSVGSSLKGLWVFSECDSEGRKLISRPLPRVGQEAEGNGFLILVPDEGWVAPLSFYLMSELVQKWLDHHAERRGERWILNEQIIKWIPVPKPLLAVLGVPSALEEPPPSFTLPLPEDWEKLVSEVAYQPQAIKAALTELNPNHPSNLRIHATIFVRAARALDYVRYGQKRLFSLVKPDGSIRWRELLDILPKGECVTLSLHPKIRLSGSLPPHLPIGKMDRVKSPRPGILLATESGFSLHICAENSAFIHILWEQLEGLTHPTWNELLQYLRVPRKIEMAESTALDVLQSHSEQTLLLQDLRDLLAMCQLF